MDADEFERRPPRSGRAAARKPRDPALWVHQTQRRLAPLLGAPVLRPTGLALRAPSTPPLPKDGDATAAPGSPEQWTAAHATLTPLDAALTQRLGPLVGRLTRLAVEAPEYAGQAWSAAQALARARRLLAAWDALRQVTGATPAAAMALMELAAGLFPDWRLGLPAHSLPVDLADAASPVPPALPEASASQVATAAHPRAGRGTRYRPPKPESAPVDLHPWLIAMGGPDACLRLLARFPESVLATAAAGVLADPDAPLPLQRLAMLWAPKAGPHGRRASLPDRPLPGAALPIWLRLRLPLAAVHSPGHRLERLAATGWEPLLAYWCSVWLALLRTPTWCAALPAAPASPIQAQALATAVGEASPLDGAPRYSAESHLEHALLACLQPLANLQLCAWPERWTGTVAADTLATAGASLPPSALPDWLAAVIDAKPPYSKASLTAYKRGTLVALDGDRRREQSIHVAHFAALLSWWRRRLPTEVLAQLPAPDSWIIAFQDTVQCLWQSIDPTPYSASVWEALLRHAWLLHQVVERGLPAEVRGWIFDRLAGNQHDQLVKVLLRLPSDRLPAAIATVTRLDKPWPTPDHPPLKKTLVTGCVNLLIDHTPVDLAALLDSLGRQVAEGSLSAWHAEQLLRFVHRLWFEEDDEPRARWAMFQEAWPTIEALARRTPPPDTAQPALAASPADPILALPEFDGGPCADSRLRLLADLTTGFATSALARALPSLVRVARDCPQPDDNMPFPFPATFTCFLGIAYQERRSLADPASAPFAEADHAAIVDLGLAIYPTLLKATTTAIYNEAIDQGLAYWRDRVSLRPTLLRLLHEYPGRTLELIRQTGFVATNDHPALTRWFSDWVTPDSLPDVWEHPDIPEPIRCQVTLDATLEAAAARVVGLAERLGEPIPWTSRLRLYLDAADRDRELTGLLDRADAAPLSPGAQRRLEHLQRLEPPRDLSPAQREAVAERLHAAADLLLLKGLESAIQHQQHGALRRLIGRRPHPTELHDDVLNALLLYGSLNRNRRCLARLLKAHFDGDADWVAHHPENLQWRRLGEAAGLQLAPWYSGDFERRYDAPLAVHIRLVVEPFDVLQMGNKFHTCLAVGGFNAHAAVANAVDLNKAVAYLHDQRGRLIARRLLAIDTDWRLVAFPIYLIPGVPYDTVLDASFDRYCRELAAHCGLGLFSDVSQDYTVKSLVATHWYDDCAGALRPKGNADTDKHPLGRSSRRPAGPPPVA